MDLVLLLSRFAQNCAVTEHHERKMLIRKHHEKEINFCVRFQRKI
jgi:hypothetical protein